MKNLLLLHGALGYGKQFDALRPLLEKDFTLHTPTFSGHGGSDVPATLSIQSFAEETSHYIQQNIEGETYVFGHSMGGYVALYIAANKMAPVAKIMTLGTKQHWSPEIAANEAKMLNTDKLKEKVPAFAQYLQKLHGDSWEQLCHTTAQMLTDMGNTPPLTDEGYSQIEIPVQLCLGDKDRMVSLEETIEVYRKLPNSTLLVLPNTPHPYEQVNVERVAYEIKAFLA